ncbi:hypothetical protein VW29_17735 [Devosia limi DSM 17137]|uniref:O-Antigen ligase n=2 Tax=Devosia TaxID=46913 RepID=A0A0F5LCP3_9HYPH|nr:hypothetical protein VW29_17735 [Devosia limi DSM 17137]SHF31906.1 hypothetical protein SAMN02745223_02336 [Devosia limi DSM 17137]
MVGKLEPQKGRYWKYLCPSNDQFLTLIIAALLVASLFIYIQRPLWAYGVFVASGGLLFFSTRRELWPLVLRHKWLIGAYGLALTVALPVAAYNNATAVLHYGMAGLTLALALALYLQPRPYLLASRIVLVCFQISVFVFAMRVGFDDFPLEKMFSESSSNGITSSLIVLQVNYLAVLFVAKGRVATLTTIATLVLCIVGYGRASVLTALLLMVVVTIFPLPLRFNWTAMARRAALIAITVCATLFSFGLLSVPAVSFMLPWEKSPELGDNTSPSQAPQPQLEAPQSQLEASQPRIVGPVVPDIEAPAERPDIGATKLQSGLYDQARTDMIREYVMGMSGLELIVGRSYEGLSIMDRYNGNPHNSYIRAHHIFGLLYGLVIAAITLAAIFSATPIIDKAFMTALLVALLFRGFTETLIFPTVFDVVYFGICVWLLERGWNRRQAKPVDRGIPAPS